MLRKVAVAAASNPHVEIRQDGEKFYIKTSTSVRTTEINFHIGEEFDEETVDGRKCKVNESSRSQWRPDWGLEFFSISSCNRVSSVHPVALSYASYPIPILFLFCTGTEEGCSMLLRAEGDIPPLLLVGITVTSVPSLERLSELLRSLWANFGILICSQAPAKVCGAATHVCVYFVVFYYP